MLKYVNLSELGEKSIHTSAHNYECFEELPNTNPLVIADMSELIVYSNQSFKNIFGKIKDNKITCLKTEPDIEYLLRNFAQSNYSGIECEVDVMQTKCPVKNFSVSVERVFVKGVEYLILMFKVLEEKNKLELKLNNLNHALEYGNIPIMIIDAEGKVNYATAFFDKILDTPIELIYNNYIHDILAKYINAQETKSLVKSVKDQKPWSAVIISEIQKDTAHYYDLKLLPITSYDGSVNFILSGNNITEHITKAQLIKKNETQLRSIINNISDLLLLIRYKKGAYLFEDANENFCRTFSIDKKKRNRELSSVLKEEFTTILLNEIENFDNDKQNLIEFRYSDNNKDYLVKVSFVINSLINEVIYIVNLSDITDQLVSQEQLKKAFEKENHFNRLKSAILKNMSHEIRTPLNALIGYSEIIEEGLALKDYNVLSEVTHSLKDILNRILNLFSNIVEVSHIESNEFEFEFYELDVNKILKSVYNKKHTEALHKDLDIRLELSEKEIPIKIDWIKMEKVVFALVDNAIKYTHSGSVIIRSEVINRQAVISIIDSGIGMYKDKIKNFVEAFIQAEEGYTKYFEGAGLGLTLAYNYVEKMGGKFFIESEVNKGTVVQIIFPLVEIQ